MRTRTATAAVALAAALAVPLGPAAQAKEGELIRTGSCSGSADWKLKVARDDGVLELEWEVDSNRSGQVWRVRIFDNGVRVVATQRTTAPPSGSFSVEKRIPNRAGTDLIVARARDLSSGQLCRGTLTY